MKISESCNALSAKKAMGQGPGDYHQHQDKMFSVLHCLQFRAASLAGPCLCACAGGIKYFTFPHLIPANSFSKSIPP